MLHHKPMGHPMGGMVAPPSGNVPLAGPTPGLLPMDSNLPARPQVCVGPTISIAFLQSSCYSMQQCFSSIFLSKKLLSNNVHLFRNIMTLSTAGPTLEHF